VAGGDGADASALGGLGTGDVMKLKPLLLATRIQSDFFFFFAFFIHFMLCMGDMIGRKAQEVIRL
jgi:hypothetical protein